jgi:hypothetical protein
MSCCACLFRVATNLLCLLIGLSAPVAKADCIRTGQLVQLWQVSRELPDFGPISQGSCQGYHSSQARPFGAEATAVRLRVFIPQGWPRPGGVLLIAQPVGERRACALSDDIEHPPRPRVCTQHSEGALPCHSFRTTGPRSDVKDTTVCGSCEDRVTGWLA